MLKYLAKRARFEVLRRLNRFRRGFRFAHVPRKADSRRTVVYRTEDGRERQLDLRDGTSDFTVFCEVLAKGQYDISELERHTDVERRYEQILAQGKVPLIIDAGANIGLSVLHFRDSYPHAGILALEPDGGNFAELIRRIGNDPLCLCLQAALASFDGFVKVYDPGHGEWGLRTERVERGVPAYRLASAMALTSWAVEPFILKVDIEGFEQDVFDDPRAFDAFYAAYVELHDWMLPKQGTSRSFLRALSTLNRDFLFHRGSVVSIQNEEQLAE